MTASGTVDFNWIRQIRLTITGLAKKVAEEKFVAYADREYMADGSANRLRISAAIRKASGGVGDPAQITVWNLSPSTRSALQRNRTKIQIETCWRDGPRGGDWEEVFYGDLLNSETYRSDADLVTVIYAVSGVDALSRAQRNQTYRDTDVERVVAELAEVISGESRGTVTFDRKNLVGIRGRLGERGWGAVGPAKHSLNRLAQQYGFSWSIVDRQFRATGDRDAGVKTTTIKDPELIEVNPVFSNVLQMDNGISWACQYNPAILPHDGIMIKSSIPENAERYGGRRKVILVTHDIDSHSSRSFITRGTCYAIAAGG